MVLVLGKGYELFYGPPKEAEKWFTTGLGLNCPPETSIPDFIMDQANTDFDKSAYYGGTSLKTVKDLEKVSLCYYTSKPLCCAAAGNIECVTGTGFISVPRIIPDTNGQRHGY